MTGVVISYNGHRQFGFIQNDSGDYFFHERNAYKGVKVGDQVRFNLVNDKVRGVRKDDTEREIT